MIPSIDKGRHGLDGQKCADAHQGEKDKKRRKCTLSGVCAPVNRWYRQNIRNTAVLCSGVNCPRFRVFCLLRYI